MSLEELKAFFEGLSFKSDEIITDKEKAIEALCQTNRAWSHISPELQADPEVIVFYQPIGHASSYYASSDFCEGDFAFGDSAFIEFYPVWADNLPNFPYQEYSSMQWDMRTSAEAKICVVNDDELVRTMFPKLADGEDSNDLDDVEITIYSRTPLIKKLEEFRRAKRRQAKTYPTIKKW